MMASRVWTSPVTRERFEEAIEQLRRRAVLTDEEWRQAQGVASDRAFWLAGVARESVARQVHAELMAALEAGQSVVDARKRIEAMLTAEWAGTVDDPGFRVETIVRNAQQQAYSRGRYSQMTRPAVTRSRPVWEYDGIGDQRQSEICRKHDGVRLRHDDPAWGTRVPIPPAHHRCRSQIRTLRTAQAERRGGLTARQDIPAVRMQDGFGQRPSLTVEEDKQQRDRTDRAIGPMPTPRLQEERWRMRARGAAERANRK